MIRTRLSGAGTGSAGDLQSKSKGTGQEWFLAKAYLNLSSLMTPKKQLMIVKNRKELFGYCLL
jgi:hypothetical protein